MRIPRHIILYKVLSSRKSEELSIGELSTFLDDKMSWATLFKAIEDLARLKVISTRKKGKERLIKKLPAFYIIRADMDRMLKNYEEMQPSKVLDEKTL